MCVLKESFLLPLHYYMVFHRAQLRALLTSSSTHFLWVISSVVMHNLDFHVYADDVQVYISFNPKEPNAAMEALRKLELCIIDLKNWMKTNKLMLNNNKTEFFIAGSRQSIQRLPPVQLQGDSTIMPSCHIRNLGVMFDTHMTMSKQVSAIVSSANYQLRNLWRLHRYLDQETRHQVVRALILSRLDYGNALLYGITSKELKRLQSIQNKSAKFIFSASRRDSPAPLLHSLHWLPVRERIFFKLCLYVYKSLNGYAPQYLTDSLKAKSRPLQGPVTRSASDNTLLVVPPTRTQNGDKLLLSQGLPHGTLFHATFVTLQILTVSKRS